MKPIVPFLLAAVLLVPLGGAATAQLAPGPLPSTLPPPPPPPPPPRVEVPVVPKLDAPQPAPRALSPGRRSSFGDRVVDCLTDGNAARLSANDRATYSRACANQ